MSMSMPWRMAVEGREEARSMSHAARKVDGFYL